MSVNAMITVSIVVSARSSSCVSTRSPPSSREPARTPAPSVPVRVRRSYAGPAAGTSVPSDGATPSIRELLLRPLAHGSLEPAVRGQHPPAANDQEGAQHSDRCVVEREPGEVALERDPG